MMWAEEALDCLILDRFPKQRLFFHPWIFNRRGFINVLITPVHQDFGEYHDGEIGRQSVAASI